MQWMMWEAPGGSALGISVALGVGLLIGIERERRKGSGDDRKAAGLRTFAVAALIGALAQALAQPALVVIAALLIVALASLSYWKSRSRDPGLTTELALFATFLIGVQAVITPWLAAAFGVGLAALLAARERLHRFATQLLTEQELNDGLMLAAMALIVLPLMPVGPVAALAGIDLRSLMALVVLIMALQAAGHVALRWLGARGGMLLSGFLSGFVSSTATIAAMGGKARAEPDQLVGHAAAASLSAAATWVQAVVLTAALSPSAVGPLLPIALAGITGVVLITLPRLFAATDVTAGPVELGSRSALRPRAALAVALLLGTVAFMVSEMRRRYGDLGLNAGVAIAALVDAHAPIASLASMHSGHGLTNGEFIRGALVAISSNTVMRVVVARVAGGRAFAGRVVGALGVSLALAWLSATLFVF